MKAVMVPTGPTSLVAVESRRAAGYDTLLPKTGVLVYTLDTSITSGTGPIQVLPNNLDKYTSPLAAGDQLTIGKVTIKVILALPGGDVVQVTVAK